MQPDSQEPPHIRECNYSHNIFPSLHCKKPPCSFSHHSNFPGAFMYEEVFRDGYRLHIYSAPLQTLMLPSFASSHYCSMSVIKACPFLPFGIPSCSISLSCWLWWQVTRSARCACSLHEGHHLKSAHKPVILSWGLFLVGRCIICGTFCTLGLQWSSIFSPVRLHMAL